MTEPRITKRGHDGKRLDHRTCPGSVDETGRLYHSSGCCLMSDDEILEADITSAIKTYQPSRFKRKN